MSSSVKTFIFAISIYKYLVVLSKDETTGLGEVKFSRFFFATAK